MKRYLSMVLVLSLLLGIVSGLAGCGKNNNESSETMTRAEWIGALAGQYNLGGSVSEKSFFSDVPSSNIYYDAIQACAEWNIIDAPGTFEPDKLATNRFAAITAVKAIGLSDIAVSEYDVNLVTDEEILEFFRQHADDDLTYKALVDKALTRVQAAEVLSVSTMILDGLVLTPLYKMDYKENVVTMEMDQIAFSADGTTARLKGSTAKIGDIIVVEPNPAVPLGKYVKVDAIENGLITYTDAKIDDICTDFAIRGTFQPKILAAVPLSSSVEIVSIGNETVVAQPGSLPGGNTDYFYVKSGQTATPTLLSSGNESDSQSGKLTASVNEVIGGITITGEIIVNLDKITPNVDYSNPTKGRLQVHNTVFASLSISGKVEHDFPVAVAVFTVAGAVTLSGEVNVHVGLDGSITVSVEVSAAEDVEWGNGFPKICAYQTSDPIVKQTIEAHCEMRPGIKATLNVLGIATAWVAVNSGIEARATAEFIQTAEKSGNCMDLRLWVPLAVTCGYELIIFFKGDKEFPIWDESESPWMKSLHIEDGVQVEKCTRDGKMQSTDIPTDDRDLFGAFEDKPDELRISTFFAALSPDGTDTLLVTQLPNGYTEKDIVYESSDANVVSVSSAGVLTSRGEGNAVIRVATSDGEYEQFCAVITVASYGVDFDPII